LLVDGFPGVPQSSEPGLIRVGGAGADDANAVIDEGRMHVRDDNPGHVAGGAIFLGHGTRLAGMVARGLVQWRHNMASHALLRALARRTKSNGGNADRVA